MVYDKGNLAWVDKYVILMVPTGTEYLTRFIPQFGRCSISAYFSESTNYLRLCPLESFESSCLLVIYALLLGFHLSSHKLAQPPCLLIDHLPEWQVTTFGDIVFLYVGRSLQDPILMNRAPLVRELYHALDQDKRRETAFEDGALHLWSYFKTKIVIASGERRC